MATNLQLDDDLLRKAQRMGRHKTKRETVNSALEEYIRARDRQRILELAGRMEWDQSYDYKALRRRR
jgi:Arc/MetJ family transcription regulator